MRLILLTILTMLAFASNSVLNRLGVGGGHIDAASFAAVRMLAGAVALSVILMARGGAFPLLERSRIIGTLSLAAYMIGFSLAYVSLDAGLGALILFGVVQVSMFVWGAVTGTRPTLRQICGASIAFGGLAVALWPSEGRSTDPMGAALMVVAGLGWAAYTLAGRGAKAPLPATAANFILATPLMLLPLIGQELNLSAYGTVLAVVAGAVTSGLGYALWYSVLPHMQASTAAVVQLSVPIIAIAAGALLLGETVTVVIGLAALLVVGGIALAVTSRPAQ
ncbi:EamA family transporter [Pseudosulfitobacter sp. SM2401]|uniref:DMT family transporter n=1 Tax=Pseudosulfitobacter sp. SM2401 TaxID=3350098 RepID=UPI0036F24F12